MKSIYTALSSRHLFVLFSFLLFSYGLVQAQAIFSNPIIGTNPNTSNPYTIGQIVDPNITVSGIGRGTGITGTNANNRYNANSWDTEELDPTAYFEWTITPNAGFEIDFASLVYTAQRSATGPSSFALRSSVDGFTSDIGTPTATGGTIDLSAAAFQGVTSTITFRLYGWNTTNPGGTFSVNDFTFNEVFELPEPDYAITTVGNTIVITDVAGNGETLDVSENGTNIRFNVAGRTYSLDDGPELAFPVDVPLSGVNSITINTEEGDDIINIGSFSANLPSLTINGGAGDDVVNFNGSITYATHASLEVNGEIVHVNNSQTMSGTGSIDITAGQSMTINASLLTVSGDITLNTAGGQDILVQAGINGLNSNNGTLFVQAGQDLILGSTSGFGDSRGSTLNLEASRDIVVTGNTFVQSDGAGGVTTQAGRNLSITQNSLINSNAGTASNSLITGANGLLSVSAGSSIGANGGPITITTDDINMEGNVGTNLNIRIQPFSAGRNIDLGSNTAGELSLTSAELNRFTSGTLIIGDDNSGDITISAPITLTNTTAVELHSSEDILFEEGFDTGGGDLLLSPGDSPAAVYPTFDGTDATVGTLSFASDLAIIINGTTPGDGMSNTYTQLSVAGSVDLTGVDLILSGSHMPVLNETFTIVENDGVDQIIGTFNGLAEGATITDFLGSGLEAIITYQGGDGNDVVLTVIENNYIINTTSGALVITEVTSNGETIDVTENGSNIRFNAAGRFFTLNGGTITAMPADIPLAGITSITINTEAGDDIINIGAFTASMPSLTVNGGTGDDVVNFNGNITFATDANLDVDLQNDDVSPGVDQVNLAIDANLALSGAGEAIIRVSRNVELNSGSGIETADGNLIIEANQQAAPTAGNFAAVVFNTVTLNTTGSGNIVIAGRGGDDISTSGHVGININTATTINASGTGSISINGIAGEGESGGRGVQIESASQIHAQFGNITLSGIGNLNSDGVRIIGGSVVSVENSGSIMITGIAGAGTQVGLVGARISNSNTQILAVNGDINIIGTGGTGSGSINDGVRIESSGLVGTSGSGNVIIQGTGAGSGSENNNGIRLQINGSINTSGTGSIFLTGTRGVGNVTNLASGSQGIEINNNVITSANGNIELMADQIFLSETESIISASASQYVAIKPLTNDGSVSIDLGGVDAIETLGLTDAELGRITAGTLIIGDDNSGDITISAPITLPNATAVELHSSGDILFEEGFDTGGGDLLLSPGVSPAAVYPTFDGTDATVGTLSFASDLAIIINGPIPGDGMSSTYTQLKVIGAVDLTGVELVLSGSHMPELFQSFTIVDNDGVDAIIGNFAGLMEGDIIFNFLGSEFDAVISYLGGDGNDVVLTVIPVCNSPVALCNAATVSIGANGEGSIAVEDIDNGSTADCGLQEISVFPTTFDCNDIGTPQIVTLTITDVNGGSSSCTASVTVADDTPPVITCQNHTVSLDGMGNTTITPEDVYDSGSDNCGTVNLVSVIPNSFTCADLGPNIVTLTVDDGNGNTSTCTATVTVEDNAPPTIDCPDSQELVLDEDCSAVLPNYSDLAIVGDNCLLDTIFQSTQPGETVTEAGFINLTLTVTDGVGNSASCSFSVEKVDETSPTVICFDQTVEFSGEDSMNLDPEELVDASDNCGIESVELNPSTISSDQIGQTIPVTVIVTDVNGNTSSCISQITVGGLPAGWSQNPNGVGCNNGNNVEYDPSTEEWAVTSTNCFSAPPYTSDATAFAQYTLCGNGSITALVTDISGTSLGWAGVVMRENNNGGAKKAQLMTNLSNFSRREFRTMTNGASQPQQFMSFNRYWLRLVRTGNQFIMYASANGVQWLFIGAQNIVMPTCIEAGLVVTNYNANSTVTATFSQVSITEQIQPQGVDMVIAHQSQLEREVSVYPNPARSELFVDLGDFQMENVTVELTDLNGRRVYTGSVDRASESIHLIQTGSLISGVYLLRVVSDHEQSEVKRVVIAP